MQQNRFELFGGLGDLGQGGRNEVGILRNSRV